MKIAPPLPMPDDLVRPVADEIRRRLGQPGTPHELTPDWLIDKGIAAVQEPPWYPHQLAVEGLDWSVADGTLEMIRPFVYAQPELT